MGKRYEKAGRGPDAYDCFGLFMDVQQNVFDVFVPDVLGDEYRAAIELQRANWRQCEAAIEGDAILFRIGSRDLHIGVALNNKDMLHAHHTGGVCVEPWNHILWKKRVLGIFRHDK